MKKDGQWEIGQQRSVHAASYDRQGRKTEQTLYNDDGTERGSIRFVYDESGRQIKALHFDTQKRLTARVVSQYDTAGRLAQSLTYTPSQELTTRTVFSYDAADRHIASQHFTSDGRLTSRTVSTYDARGNLAQKQWYRTTRTPVRTRTARYDYLGARVSDSVYDYAVDGTLNQRTDVRYNPRGHPQLEVTHRQDGRFKRERSFRYLSDAFGNWTLQTIQTQVLIDESPSFEPPRVISRTLSYYGRGTSQAVPRPQ